MPSQRKRIGFLPSAEVQKIIDQICKYNKLSQSKVTGILVEEALCYRGVLKGDLNKELLKGSNNNRSLKHKNNLFNIETLNENDNINLDESYLNNEVKMINEFIEFKFFKNIMNKKNYLGNSVTPKQ